MVIEPISELKNYNTLLTAVEDGKPIYLTKNGKGLYAIMTLHDANDYEKYKINREFENDIKPDVKDMDFFVKDIDELNKKLIEGIESLKKDKFRYHGTEIFDELRKKIYDETI